MNIALIVLSLLGAIFTFLGYVFRVMHYPMGKEMMYGGLFLFVFSISWLVYRIFRPQ